MVCPCFCIEIDFWFGLLIMVLLIYFDSVELPEVRQLPPDRPIIVMGDAGSVKVAKTAQIQRTGGLGNFDRFHLVAGPMHWSMYEATCFSLCGLHGMISSTIPVRYRPLPRPPLPSLPLSPPSRTVASGGSMASPTICIGRCCSH